MDNIRIARELLTIAKGLMGMEFDTPEAKKKYLHDNTKTAAMPSYGRERGKVKRAVGFILKKNGWTDFHIFKSRNGSGFEIHAWREAEQLPDDDLQREFEKEGNVLKRLLEQKIKPEPEDIHVEVRLNRSHQGTKAKLYVYLKYGEGFYVTPIEFL